MMIEFAVYNCRKHQLLKWGWYATIHDVLAENPTEFDQLMREYVLHHKRPRRRLFIKRGCGAEILVYNMSLGELLLDARVPKWKPDATISNHTIPCPTPR